MVVDAREVSQRSSRSDSKFEIAVNGTAMTVARIDREQDEEPDWAIHKTRSFRLCLRNEFRYSFDSTIYLYHGIDCEYAPRDATGIIVTDGVKTIRESAFLFCRSLSKITIPDSVTRIGHSAFSVCESLRCIHLPTNLKYIEDNTFSFSSLEAIYIPPTVTQIEQYAFCNFQSLRIINVQDSLQNFEVDCLARCDGIITDRLHRWRLESLFHQNKVLRDRYNRLHHLCWNPSVAPDNIQLCILQYKKERATTKDKPQFTPLHLLAANPSVTGEMITAYLQLDPDVAVVQDNIGKNSLHMLCSVPSFFDGTGNAIRAYLSFSEGRKAAFMPDNEGTTPLECLYDKSFDGLLFLENKSFGGYWFGGTIAWKLI